MRSHHAGDYFATLTNAKFVNFASNLLQTVPKVSPNVIPFRQTSSVLAKRSCEVLGIRRAIATNCGLFRERLVIFS